MKGVCWIFMNILCIRKGSLFCKRFLVLLKSDFCNIQVIPVSLSMLAIAISSENEQ